MTSFIAACGSGRSTSFIPAVPAAWSVTTIAFIVHLVVCGMSWSVTTSHPQCPLWGCGFKERVLDGPLRTQAFADRSEVDPGSTQQVDVAVCVHGGRGAVNAELPVRVRRDVAHRVDRDPEFERDHLLRHATRYPLECRAFAGR